MTQDYSTEWRAALIERVMAVRAIVEFLDAADAETDFSIVRIEESGGSAPDEFSYFEAGQEPPALDMLKRVREQLEKKLKR